MAGHLALSKFDESELFTFLEEIKRKVVLEAQWRTEFKQFTFRLPKKHLKIMKLSKDYVENPLTQIAFSIGKVSLKSITDEHPSLTQNISVEVHFEVIDSNVEIKNVFWVC
jgi:hypothetical protein